MTEQPAPYQTPDAPTLAARPRLSRLQRSILTRIADGGLSLGSDGVYCYLFDGTLAVERIPNYTAERLVLRDLVHPLGHILPAGLAALGRTR